MNIVARNVEGVISRIHSAGFNCTVTIEGKTIQTTSNSGSLATKAIEGKRVLSESELKVGMKVFISTVEENKKPNGDPFAKWVMGIKEFCWNFVQPSSYEDNEEETKFYTELSYSKNHGKNKKHQRKFEKIFEDGHRKTKSKEKGGSRNWRIFDDLEVDF